MNRKRPKYAITEIITTGLNFKKDKIIHIASYIINDETILNQYNTYINPHRILEPEIIITTGIQEHDIQNAPRFFEIAKELLDFWKDTIILSSIPRFSYTFIKNEFKSFGYNFNHTYLRLDTFLDYDSRKVKPGVGKAKYLSELYQASKSKDAQSKVDLTPKNFFAEKLKNMPNICGVYMLKNKNHDIIYIGKANKIRTRIRQHFRNLNNKGYKIHRQVADIEYQETGSELFALLLEQYLILKHKPELNKALRNRKYEYEMRMVRQIDDYHKVLIIPVNKNSDGWRIKLFRTRKNAIQFISTLIETISLHPKVVQVFRMQKNMWSHHDEVLIEPYYEYNEVIEKLMSEINPFFDNTYLIKDKNDGHKFCVVEKGNFYGFSFEKEINNSLESLKIQCKYQFESEYALNLIIAYHKQNRLNIKIIHI